MTSVFLQVRLDSSRLPRKALELLGGKTITERCFQALAAVEADRRVLVTEPGSEPELKPLALASGWECFVGSKDNVLDRFVQAARSTNTRTIIRATGDNPLVSAKLANLLLSLHREQSADYSGFAGAPLGTGVEIVEVSALEAAWATSPDAYEREHVSPFLYRRPEQFRILRPDVPPLYAAPDARVTVDTWEDLNYLRTLWTALFRDRILEVEDLIPWLTLNPR